MDGASKTCSACSRFRSILVFWAIAVLALLAVEIVFRALEVPDWLFRVFIVIWVIAVPVGRTVLRHVGSGNSDISDGQ